MRSKLLLVLLLIFALVLAACGGSSTPTPAPTQEPTAAPTDVPAEEEAAEEEVEAVEEGEAEAAEEETAEAAEEVTEEATEEAAEAVEEEAAEEGTVVEEAQAASDFTTLVAALTAANLAETLQGTGPFTVFAPTDEAFAAALSAMGMTAEQVLGNTELLTTVLLYHVVSGSLSAADIVALDGQTLTTLQGGELTVSLSDDGGVVLNGTTNVILADVPASNGVIHAIDGVLLPSMAAPEEVEGAAEEEMAEAASTSDFTTLLMAVEATGLTELLSGEGPFTVFAPTNAAIEATLASLGLTPDALLGMTDVLTGVLQYHVVEGILTSADIAAYAEAGRGIPTVEGSGITPRLTESGAITLERTVNIILADVPASNGIIHVIDGVLIPTGVPAVDPSAAPVEEGTGAPATITSACMVTDQGGVNDGTFNQLAADAMRRAAETFGLEISIIESNTPSDFEPNINTCLDTGAGAVVTVGFLLGDATLAAAQANPNVYFIGVDQFFAGHPNNLVGIQSREDQAGFLVGVMAGLLTESNVIGGVYGIDVPAVVKFRNGFEAGARYVNADVTALGSYLDSFIDAAAGAELAEALIGDGADIIFGAGGGTGSGGIIYAASQGIRVIGVDQDEYFTTFGGGESPGAEYIITSAVKRIDVGVFDMLAALVDGSVEWQGGGLYLLEAANGGIGFTESHDADVPQEVIDRVNEVFEMLRDGSLSTGIDPVTGFILEEEAAPVEEGTGAPATITSACMVTDQGGVNDGTFNQLAADAMRRAAETFGLEISIIESNTPSDFEPNINTCLDTGAGAVVTVGFLLGDATLAAAQANPNVYFIGVDQFFAGHPNNLVGIQSREDQAGFLVGVMAGLLTESNVIGGVYGIDVPAVVKFRNGFEAGARYVNADVTALGSYLDSFIDAAAGAELAEALIGDGADIIFGAGGGTGSGGIIYAASQGIRVIGVDQDEYFTTFGGGESPGAEYIITSAVKRIDVGVFDMLAALVDGSVEWQGGGLYLLEAANGGIGFTESHDADVPQEVIDRVNEVFEMLRDGSLSTGIDPVTGFILEEEAAPVEEGTGAPATITSACMVTDQGGVNDGTFNQLAADAMRRAAETFGLEISIIESNTPSDFEPNINTCLDTGAGAVVTVGFLLGDATLAAAQANPNVYFIGVDQFFAGHPNNLVGIQSREDQAGFLVGVMAGLLTESNVIGGVYGIDVPAVVKFRNGFEAGARYVNADVTALGSYLDSFIDAAAGAELAEALIGDGADIIFGAGGGTGSGGIIYAASQGIRVIGVDQDEYFTTFGGGESPGAEYIITSAVKRIDVGVFDMLAALVDGSVEWQGGGLYLLEAANGGIGFTESHDADVPQEVIDRVNEVFEMLRDGSLSTGIDPVTGFILED